MKFDDDEDPHDMRVLLPTDIDERVEQYMAALDEVGPDLIGSPRRRDNPDYLLRPPIEGFDRPEDGSEERYENRRHAVPWATHTFWWIMHNAVAHFLIAFFPARAFFDFHDFTSRKMHGK